LPAREDLDDDHCRTTVGADESGLDDARECIRRLRLGRFTYDVQQLARLCEMLPAPGVGE
jgi:hypothetical protein